MRRQDGERVVLAAILVVLGGLLVGLGIALTAGGVLVLRRARRGDG